jgi:hypothetical protein
MVNPGDVLDLDPLNMKFMIRETAETSGDESFEMEIGLGPRTGGTQVHNLFNTCVIY